MLLFEVLIEPVQLLGVGLCRRAEVLRAAALDRVPVFVVCLDPLCREVGGVDLDVGDLMSPFAVGAPFPSRGDLYLQRAFVLLLHDHRHHEVIQAVPPVGAVHLGSPLGAYQLELESAWSL